MVGREKRGGLHSFKESSIYLTGCDGKFDGESGQASAAASHCQAVPRAFVQAVTTLVFETILTSQFPEYFCHLFIPAFYLY